MNAIDMTVEQEHAALVERTKKSGHTIARELTPLDADLWHCATGVCTEGGELLDAIKKMAVYRKDIDRENVIEELGDIEWYLGGMRQAMGITRAEVLEANIVKLCARYPTNSYRDLDAVERKDKA